MDRIKHFMVSHFEQLLVAVILAAAFVGTYFIDETSVMLNFYFLPVLIAGYFLGKRNGLLAAVLSILLVLFCALLFPGRLFPDNENLRGIAQLSSWGGFLILCSVLVGSLYETKERQLIDLKTAYVGVLEILSKYLESTDPYTKGHSIRVSELACAIASHMRLPADEVDNIRVASLLHDIGKIEISGEVLRKAADLSLDEREYLDSHSERGARLLSSVGAVLKQVVPIVLAHHKYFVDQLAGTEEEARERIPLGARIVAVADSFDAMTSDRPYRRALPPWEAYQEIVKNSGNQFDPAVVDAFKEIMMRRLETV